MKGSLHPLPSTGAQASGNPLPRNSAGGKPLPLDAPEEAFHLWVWTPAAEPKLAITATADQRCSVKGCVFPAASNARTCLQHERQLHEPSLFSSRQPSLLLLDHGKFDVPDSASEPSRTHDRRRLAKIREDFLDGAA
jgi:hypothetical protein